MSLCTNGGINLPPNPWLVNNPSRQLSVVAEVLGDTRLFRVYWGAKHLQGLLRASIHEHPSGGAV